MFSESQAHILMYYKAEEEGIKKKRKKNETVKVKVKQFQVKELT